MMNHSTPNMVRILDEDRTFRAALADDELSAARQYAIASVHELGRGSYRPEDLSTGDGLLGVLVLDGVLVRQLDMAGRRCGEIVGPGALLRPWDDMRAGALPFQIDWRVLQPARLAQLDRRFLAAIMRWPALIEAFIERATERAHTLAFNVAIYCVQRVEVKLLLLFRHLADRFGKVTPAGTVVPLALSHADLAELVGAARPSVSTALKDLDRQGVVQRNRADRTWLLTSELPARLQNGRGTASRS